jgi:hypothetical protein
MNAILGTFLIGLTILFQLSNDEQTRTFARWVLLLPALCVVDKSVAFWVLIFDAAGFLWLVIESSGGAGALSALMHGIATIAVYLWVNPYVLRQFPAEE